MRQDDRYLFDSVDIIITKSTPDHTDQEKMRCCWVWETEAMSSWCSAGSKHFGVVHSLHVLQYWVNKFNYYCLSHIARVSMLCITCCSYWSSLGSCVLFATDPSYSKTFPPPIGALFPHSFCPPLSYFLDSVAAVPCSRPSVSPPSRTLICVTIQW